MNVMSQDQAVEELKGDVDRRPNPAADSRDIPLIPLFQGTMRCTANRVRC